MTELTKEIEMELLNAINKWIEEEYKEDKTLTNWLDNQNATFSAIRDNLEENSKTMAQFDIIDANELNDMEYIEYMEKFIFDILILI